MFRGTLARGGKLSKGGALLLRCVGAALILLGASEVVPAIPALVAGQRATGIVTDIREGPVRRERIVTLRVNERTVEARVTRGRTPGIVRTGQAMEVAYVPGNPEIVYPLHLSAPWGGGAAFGAIGAFLVWLARRANHAAA